ncbi:DUF6191 domain-containing protein [Umezawaea endophytica]|uniref:DUF6191 domain-containing protein n=1 Tax=Umezawaea endophytica TaxID=1654476 RepID=A0A9X3AJG6_9PSEU|nr:DUF6191 domain-containing protein [Umezawaea endophytica]MCS7484547.1 DUF6191 domain-containing protein [Umezawaea endophytica]
MGTLFALSLPGLVCLLFLLAVGERLVRRVRRRRGGAPVLSGAAFDQVTLLFYATKQAELDQRRTESMLRDEEDGAAPPRGPVDLDRGVVRLSPAAPRRRPPAG